jgi:hypothetical protein
MRRLFVFLIILSACTDKSKKQSPTSVDTTQVIQLALKTVLTESFPEMDGLKRKSIFKDTIFLTTNLFSLSALPSKVDSFKFKVLPDTLICSMLKIDTVNEELPNFLRLQSFEKTDTDYVVRFESVDCVPSPSRDGAVSLHILKTIDKYTFKNK